MRRDWTMKSIIPAALVEEASLATSACEHGWRTQRVANNFKDFAPNLERVLAIVRKEADIRKEAGGFASRYDALLDIYEPGLSSSKLDEVFGEVKTWLPGLIQRAQQFQACQPDAIMPTQVWDDTCDAVKDDGAGEEARMKAELNKKFFSENLQKELCIKIMEKVGEEDTCVGVVIET